MLDLYVKSPQFTYELEMLAFEEKKKKKEGWGNPSCGVWSTSTSYVTRNILQLLQHPRDKEKC